MTDLALLEGVRVLEFATGVAGPYAGKLFADYGADVVKVEPPEGDEVRRWSPFLTPATGPATSALFLHLNTNKRSVTLDPSCDEGHGLAEQLISSADVVIESYRPGTLEAWGLGFEKMRSLNPSITLTSVTPFGQDGPYRDYKGSEVVYWALAGMNFTREWDGMPVTLGGNLAQYQAGNLAAAATIAALMQAETTGDGIHVDASHLLAQVGSASGAMTYLVAHAYNGRTSAPARPSPEAPAARSPFGPLPNGAFRCTDGAVMVSTLQAWVPRMLRVIGDAELFAIFGDAQRLAEPATAERVSEIASGWFATRSRADAMTLAQAAGWPVTAVQSPCELAGDAHFLERGGVIEAAHPVAGRVAQPGPPFHIEVGWSHRHAAPRLGEHNQEVLADPGLTYAKLSDSGRTGHLVPGTGLPLEGLRVVDMTVAWSGPFTTMLLADLGAEVIRVENPWAFPSSTRGVYPRPSPEAVVAADNLNMSGYPELDPGHQPWNRSAVFNWHGRNKRSATLDIRKPSGRELLLRLLEVSDVLVENNPPKLLDALDLGYEDMAGRTPNLVVLRMPAGGLTGPYRDFVGFGGSFEGLVGLRSLRGYPTTSPENAPGSLHMDTASGTTGAFAVLAALRRRVRTGQGVLIDLSQLENLVQQIGEFVMAGARGVAFGPAGNRDDRHAPQGVYPCAGEDRWVAISVGSDDEWRALTVVMGDPVWAEDPTLSAARGRMAAQDYLDQRISAWTMTMDRHDVFHLCQAAGIAAAPVMDEADLYADPQLEHLGFFRPLQSVHTGRHLYPAHPLRWSGPPLRWDWAAPGLGDDSEYVFRQVLGLSEDEYEQLAAEGHLSQDYLDREGNRL